MQERFKQLLEAKGLTATKFAAVIKVNASAMSHILNGRSKPGFDVLDKIGQAFPDVNLNWLITGQGTPFVSKQEETEVKVKPKPVQRTLFEEKIESVEPPKEPEVKKIIPVQDVVQTLTKIPEGKKIQRIILFFDDGSFEDYEKK